jgi:hypothetical protein
MTKSPRNFAPLTTTAADVNAKKAGATTQQNRGDHPREKNFENLFLEILLGVKTGGKSEFDIFEAKNAFLIQGRPVY